MHDLFTEEEHSDLSDEVVDLLRVRTEDPDTQAQYAGHELYQVGVLGFEEPDHDNYVDLKFTKTYKLSL